MEEQDLLASLALTQVQGVGSITAKHLLAWFKSPNKIFSATEAQLRQVEGVGPVMVQAIQANRPLFDKAHQIFERCHKKKIDILTIASPEYPKRLKEIPDAPTVLYTIGQAPVDTTKVVSIVGTRKNSAYGERMTKQLVEQLDSLGVSVVSGLAFGIDTVAHQASLNHKMITYAVLATPPDQVYPAQNRALAIEIFRNGRIFSEYPPGSKVDARNFPMRNRIIAGLADATIVVEAGLTGGALITASVAQDYDRQVFAFPGRLGDERSTGCLNLIAQNKAAIFSSFDFFVAEMGWATDLPKKAKKEAPAFPSTLTETEKAVLTLLATPTGMHIDDVSFSADVPLNLLAGILLKLEFEGLVSPLPGKKFRAADAFIVA